MLQKYDAPDIEADSGKHTVLLKFLCGEHRAEVISELGGNCYGGDILGNFTDLSIGLVVCIERGKNAEHCIPYEGEEGKYVEVEYIRLTHPTKSPIELDLEEAQSYLVGIEIIGYEECDGEQ